MKTNVLPFKLTSRRDGAPLSQAHTAEIISIEDSRFRLRRLRTPTGVFFVTRHAMTMDNCTAA